MGRSISQRVQERVDKVAYTMVLMERGEYEFSDGKPKWGHDEQGRKVHRVVQGEAVRHVWGNDANETLHNLFHEKGRWHSLLQDRIAYHRQRLDEGYRQALAKLTDDGSALTVMSSKLYESLWWDLNDEETCRKIPFRERAKFFETLTKMDASIKGDVNTQGQHKLQPSVVIQNINVPDSVKQRMISNMEIMEGEAEEVGENG